MCCICGSVDGVAHCKWCGHDFCRAHRRGWYVWERGVAAVKLWLWRNPPRYCAHVD
jgi:hypothetical protein